MDKIIFYRNENGDIVQVTDYEVVDRDELTTRLEEAKALVRELQDAVVRFDRLNDTPASVAGAPTTLLKADDDGDGHVKFKQITI